MHGMNVVADVEELLQRIVCVCFLGYWNFEFLNVINSFLIVSCYKALMCNVVVNWSTCV